LFTNNYSSAAIRCIPVAATASADLGFNVAGSERARIDSSGRLLVGTSSARTGFSNDATVSPKVQFEATGSTYNDAGRFTSLTWNSNNEYSPGLFLAKSRSTSVGGVTIVNNNDELGLIQFCGADGTDLPAGAQIGAYVDGTPGANDMPGRLVFSTTADGASSPTERMRITQAGDVRIGTTTAVTTNVKGVDIVDNSATMLYRSGANSTSSVNHVAFFNPNGNVGAIATSASATSYTTSSDYRLKENVVPLTGAADRLNQLQVHRFNFIANPDTTVDGFLAHEAQAVVPECVTGTKDEVDADGNPVYQGIDQSKLVPLLTAALQEAIAKIETLEAKVAALEAS
jgi:hypothetical protein